MDIRIRNKIKKIIIGIKGANLDASSQVYFSVEIQTAKGIVLGKESIIYKECTIYNSLSGKFEMGSFSHVAPYGYFLIGENSVKIGNDVAIGPFCSFFCMSNNPKGESRLYRENYLFNDIVIGNNVFIGSHSIFLPGTKIRNNVVVGANSVVSGVLEEGWIYAGSPAVKVRKVTE
jgi:acetyltransferase-like isoleucine patch superfamily enzyme